MAVLIVVVLLSILSIFVLALIVHWRVLPRHFIPLVALVNLLYAYGLASWSRIRWPYPAVSVVAIIFLAYSSLSVRLEPRHAKDDYERAAALAAAEIAKGGRVWWIADPRGALYYGLPVESADFVHPYSSLPADEAPSLVLVSRPETYDSRNVVANYLAANGYRAIDTFPAFTAWQR